MGLIKEIKKISEVKNIPVDDKLFQQIDAWKRIYQGYYPEWHRVKYHTLSGEKERDLNRLGMAKVVANEMASLIFNENCEVNISDESFQKVVQDVLDNNSFRKKFQDHLEYMFGLGGTVLKPYVDKGKIKISYVTADAFIPVSWDNNGVFEAVFPYQARKGEKYYTHLEWHLKRDGGYRIVNELYESDNSAVLGRKVSIKVLYPDLEPEVHISGLERPLFVYIKPNIANNFDLNSPLGIPLYANALDTLHSLDIAFDSFQREFRLGKKRILIPATAVRGVVDPQTNTIVRYFDTNDEVYQAISTSDLDSQKIYDNSVPLRIEEHIEAINALLNILAMQVGFSPGTFTFDGVSVKTATEVISENSKTFKSKKSHENLVEQGIKELVECIAILGKLYKLFPVPAEYEVNVNFDDSIIEDENAEIDKQIKLVSGGLTSRKKAIMKIFKVDEEEAARIIAEIIQEERRQSPDLEELEAEAAMFGVRE